MSAQSLQVVTTSLSLVPLPVIFAPVAAPDSPAAESDPNAGLADENEEKLLLRATRVTMVLRSIEGYDHFGIND